MVQELLPLLPKELGTLALVLAVAGAVAGVGLWLVGSRFSRSLVTLLLVSVGGWTGLFFPRWFGWAIDGWAPAVGLAVVLGAAGDRKSTRLNSSHANISYAVFCL